ncbi:glutamate--cysteine ligase catalytic subunit-like protein [Ramicandelaber brevisporus]|nr:glutamate--cysteine ligase catalytic subunit-like protein [Ramicandelaber brevisporus]
MGLLTLGGSLPWSIIKKHTEPIRTRGVQQLIKIYDTNKSRRGDPHLFGDEIEYSIIRFDHSSRLAQAALHSHEMLDMLHSTHKMEETDWQPEYGRFMLEGIPGSPYGSGVDDLLDVEKNMATRRKQVNEAVAHFVDTTIDKDITTTTNVLSITSLPRLGCGPDSLYHPTENVHKVGGPIISSALLPDEVITGHARYHRMQANIFARRQEPMRAHLPIFRDKKTPTPFCHKYSNDCDPAHRDAQVPDDHIVVDATCFGTGCSCLQITMQADNIDEARHLYDQLAVIAPILMAASAAAPIFRGHLMAADCRWNVIKAATDDRPAYERGLLAERPPPDSAGCTNGTHFIQPKARYSAISTYLAPAGRHYNDAPLNQDLDVKAELMASAGMDEQLAAHFAFLFTRDPIMVYDHQTGGNEDDESDQFECLQSTNWNSMRFKPPPPSKPFIGWRIEFRTLEAQFTDFENAAFTAFVVMLARAIMANPDKLTFYIPISRSDENMERGQLYKAVTDEKFWFRTNIYDASENVQCEEMSLSQIMNVLIDVVNKYLDDVKPSPDTRKKLNSYIDLIKQRADGKLLTDAAWIRKFVDEHPAYKHDSVVSAEVNYDLLKAIADIASGARAEPLLYGDLIH